MLKSTQDHKIILNIAIHLNGANLNPSPKTESDKPITKDDALAVNVAPPDPFLDKDKIAQKTKTELGPVVDGEYFRPTNDGLKAALQKLEKKRKLDYYDHPAVIMARKMLKGG
jgi:hypothetical protein